MALGFCVLLNWTILEKRYLEAYLYRYHQIGENLSENLKTGLDIDKSRDLIQSIQESLVTTFIGETGGLHSNFEKDVHFSVCSTDGKLIYSESPEIFQGRVPQIVRALFRRGGQTGSINWSMTGISFPYRYAVKILKPKLLLPSAPGIFQNILRSY